MGTGEAGMEEIIAARSFQPFSTNQQIHLPCVMHLMTFPSTIPFFDLSLTSGRDLTRDLPM
jgi:hypothetical protein